MKVLLGVLLLNHMDNTQEKLVNRCTLRKKIDVTVKVENEGLRHLKYFPFFVEIQKNC